MVVYFRFQYKRLIRTLSHLGINPYLGILLGILTFVIISNLLFKRITYCQYFYSIAALVTLSQLSTLQRNDFLKNIYTADKYIKLRLLENALLALPFVLFLVVKGFYMPALVTAVCALLISFYNKIGRSAFIIPSPFSKKPFEFSVGFRKHYWLFIMIYAISIISIWVVNFNLGIFAYLITWLVCMGFYSVAEPVFFVWIFSQQPPGFLKSKIKTAVVYSLFISSPLAIALICFYPSYTPVVALVCLCGLLYVILGVVAKYAGYPDQISLLHVLAMGIGMICPPLLLLLIPYFYKRSVKKLSIYLK